MRHFEQRSLRSLRRLWDIPLIFILLSASRFDISASNLSSVDHRLDPIIYLEDFSVQMGDNKCILITSKDIGRHLWISSMNWADVIYYLGQHIHSKGAKVTIEPYFYFRDTRSVIRPKPFVVMPAQITRLLHNQANSMKNSVHSLARKVPDASGWYSAPERGLKVGDFGHWITSIISSREGYMSRFQYRLTVGKDEVRLIIASGPDDLVPWSDRNIYETRRVRIVAQLPGSFNMDSVEIDSEIPEELPPYGNGIALDPEARVLTLVLQKEDAQTLLLALRSVFGSKATIIEPDADTLFPWLHYKSWGF